jgi:Domain of unknown function (DUF4292)
MCFLFILPFHVILTLNREVTKLKFHKFRLFSILLATGFLISCGTETVQVVPASTPLLIETKAQVKNGSDSNNVKIEIALAPNKMIRMEVTALMGYRVASVLLTPQKIQYAIHTNQTYGEGNFSARTMYPIFKQHVDPRIIWRVINNQNPQSQDLVCQTDQQQRPVLCNGPQGSTVKWTYEEAPVRRIEIKSGKFEMNWLFKGQKVLADSQTETFVLKRPEGYKEIQLK